MRVMWCRLCDEKGLMRKHIEEEKEVLKNGLPCIECQLEDRKLYQEDITKEEYRTSLTTECTRERVLELYKNRSKNTDRLEKEKWGLHSCSDTLVKYVEYMMENDDGMYIAIFENTDKQEWELADPDMINASEIRGQRLYKECSKCSGLVLLSTMGEFKEMEELDEDDLCECEKK